VWDAWDQVLCPQDDQWPADHQGLLSDGCCGQRVGQWFCQRGIWGEYCHHNATVHLSIGHQKSYHLLWEESRQGEVQLFENGHQK